MFFDSIVNKKKRAQIYKPLELTRAVFYLYVKILDNNTNEEIKNMGIKK